jgi:D-hydroxyproline dehydrogenase subunit beta
MSARGKVVVVGAGIVGAACARTLALEGFEVVVLESREVAGGATAAGMGHIVVMDDSEAQFALTRYSRRLWDEISPSLPAECEVDPCGTLWLAADAEELEAVASKEAYYRERGVGVRALDAAALAEHEPNLRPGLSGGLLVPGDFVVYPPTVAAWLLEDAGRHGARLRLDAEVSEFLDRRVCLTDGSSIDGDLVVNATGSWIARLMPEWQVRPRKGHLIITDRFPGFVRHQLIELGYLKSAHALNADSVAFNVQPRRSGQLLVGSSRQFGDETLDVNYPLLARMVSRAVEYLPGLAELPAIRVWTGFRAATPDKLPLVGPCPGRDGVYLATGHEGLGITTSLATARLLTDQIMGRKSEIPPEPYLPARFSIVP